MRAILNVIAAMLFPMLFLVSSDASAKVDCGKEGGKPCKIWERIPACNLYLVENFATNQCVHPKHCGSHGQRPCTVVERIPACDKGLQEDFLQGKCLKSDEVLTVKEIERRAEAAFCKGMLNAVRKGEGAMGAIINEVKKKDHAGVRKNPKLRQELQRVASTYAHQLPEIKRIATIMNDPKNRRAVESIFSPENFCSGDHAATAGRLKALDLHPRGSQSRGSSSDSIWARLAGAAVPSAHAATGGGTATSHIFHNATHIYSATYAAVAGGGYDVVLSYARSEGPDPYGRNVTWLWPFMSIGPRGATNISSSLIFEFMYLLPPGSRLGELKGWDFYMGGGLGEGLAAGYDVEFGLHWNPTGIGGGAGLAAGFFPGEFYGGFNYRFPLFPHSMPE